MSLRFELLGIEDGFTEKTLLARQIQYVRIRRTFHDKSRCWTIEETQLAKKMFESRKSRVYIRTLLNRKEKDVEEKVWGRTWCEGERAYLTVCCLSNKPYNHAIFGPRVPGELDQM